jgi:hypothetical protein
LTKEDIFVNATSVTPSRKSQCNAATADQDSVERATKLKARKNLDKPILSGNKETDSFLSFSCDEVVNNVSSVGIKLGTSSARIGKAVTNLKQIERSRLQVAPVLDRTIQPASKLIFKIFGFKRRT